VKDAFTQKNGQVFINPNLPLDPVRKIPAALIPASGEFGTMGRNTFTGDGYNNIDLAVVKQTSLSERIRMQARVEVFNLLNSTSLALPQRRLTDPSFGLSRKTRTRRRGARHSGGGPRYSNL
jgi:hypothetical protein